MGRDFDDGELRDFGRGHPKFGWRHVLKRVINILSLYEFNLLEDWRNAVPYFIDLAARPGWLNIEFIIDYKDNIRHELETDYPR